MKLERVLELGVGALPGGYALHSPLSTGMAVETMAPARAVMAVMYFILIVRWRFVWKCE